MNPIALAAAKSVTGCTAGFASWNKPNDRLNNRLRTAIRSEIRKCAAMVEKAKANEESFSVDHWTSTIADYQAILDADASLAA